jgi:hypothetical protein
VQASNLIVVASQSVAAIPFRQSMTIRPSRRRIYGGDLPTPRTTLRTGYVRVLVFCNSCRHRADADLPAIVESGRGGVIAISGVTPIASIKSRAAACEEPEEPDDADAYVRSPGATRPPANELSRCRRLAGRSVSRPACRRCQAR